MIEQIGLNIIIPITVFLIIIVGAHVVTDEALADLAARKAQK